MGFIEQSVKVTNVGTYGDSVARIYLRPDAVLGIVDYGERGDPNSRTMVFLNDMHLHVMESAEEVARRVDAALAQRNFLTGS